jgi:toxin ParE1/3/4
MTEKPVRLREQASQDIQEIIHYLLDADAESAAMAIIQELQEAYELISRHPFVGSTRHAYELDLPELRSWPLQRFPYLVFYVDCPQQIDVWRVLHSKKDIPAWLLPPPTIPH